MIQVWEPVLLDGKGVLWGFEENCMEVRLIHTEVLLGSIDDRLGGHGFVGEMLRQIWTLLTILELPGRSVHLPAL